MKTSYRALCWLLMAAAACTTSCTKDEVDITGGVAGIVTDARSGEPLSGVGITITPSGKTATTAADGRYEIQRIEAQEYRPIGQIGG